MKHKTKMTNLITKTFIILTTLWLVSCNSERRSFQFNQCVIHVPEGFESVEYTNHREEFHRLRPEWFSIIGLKDLPDDFEESLQKEDIELIKYFEHKNYKFWVYDANDDKNPQEFISQIKIIAIEQDGLLFTLLNMSKYDLKPILNSCFDEKIIKQLEKVSSSRKWIS